MVYKIDECSKLKHEAWDDVVFVPGVSIYCNSPLCTEDVTHSLYRFLLHRGGDVGVDIRRSGPVTVCRFDFVLHLTDQTAGRSRRIAGIRSQ